MHFQIFLLALVAPLAHSLPQPVPQGESGALVARQGSGNFTGGVGEGEHRKGRHHGPPEGPHPERALVGRQESGNSTVGGVHGHPSGKEYGGKPPGGPGGTLERQGSGNSTGGAGKGGSSDLKDNKYDSGNSTGGAGKGGSNDLKDNKYNSGNSTGGAGKVGSKDLKDNKYDSGNSTGGAGKGGPNALKGNKYHGGPPYPERERQESDNSTSGGESHGKGENYHEEGHPGPKVDKRIEEINGTTGGYTGTEKFKPDGHHGGPQRPGEHKRSIIDMLLDRRQDNSTSSGEGGREKHYGKKGHLEHKRPE